MSVIKRKDWLTVKTLLMMGLTDIGSLVEVEPDKMLDVLHLYSGFIAELENNPILMRELED